MSRPGVSSVVGPVFILLGVAALIAVPSVVSTFYVFFTINVMVSALVAMSFNLQYGNAGMFCFGQAAYYGLGAYVTAILLNHESGVVVAMLAAVGVAAVVGILAAVLLVGLERIAFVMLTFVMAEVFLFWARQLTSLTGGDSGLSVIVPFEVNILAFPTRVYYIVLAIVLLVMACLAIIVKSPFGLRIRAIKDNPARVEALGINVWREKVIVFVISAMVAAVAGALSAVVNQVVYPGLFGWMITTNALIAVLLGGSRYFFGPAAGAILLGVIGLVAGRVTTNLVAVTGVVFFAVVLLAPQGLIAVVVDTFKRMRRRWTSAPPAHQPARADAMMPGVQP